MFIRSLSLFAPISQWLVRGASYHHQRLFIVCIYFRKQLSKENHRISLDQVDSVRIVHSNAPRRRNSCHLQTIS